ncbi:MAG TPA: LPXTG cell wall anchor domain-containing protein [Mycobacteriales bacterium]|nr:LPXTG cell wall anchor domain-containing protein [Mycobacteriales bacterium]
MTRTALVSTTGAALGLSIAGALALPGAAFAAVDPYIPNQIHCTVTPGTTTSGKPVTVAVLDTLPGATVTVKGAGPVSVSTGSGKVGSSGNVNLTEGTGPGDGAGTFAVTVSGKTSRCQVQVKPLVIQPTQVAKTPQLPFTGASDITPAILGAVALVAVGGGLVVSGRRRRHTV